MSCAEPLIFVTHLYLHSIIYHGHPYFLTHKHHTFAFSLFLSQSLGTVVSVPAPAFSSDSSPDPPASSLSTSLGYLTVAKTGNDKQNSEYLLDCSNRD